MALIDDFQQQIDARLSELQPAFAEYTALQQLREAIKSLDPEAAAAHVSLFPFPVGGAAPADGSAPRTPPADGGSPGRRRRARAAQAMQGPSVEDQTAAHTEAAIQLVAEEPGLTANQLAERMGVPASVLFRLLPTLQREGRLRKQGKGYRPV